MNNMNHHIQAVKTAIIYVRVSSEEQVQGTSLDFQERACQRYCEEQGYSVLKVFREEGASAKTSNRKAFLKSIEYCRQRNREGKPVQAYVVHKCDRFSRDTHDHFYVKSKLNACGTSLFSVSEPIGDSPEGRMFETLLSGFAEFDNAIRRQRSMDGLASRVKMGIYPFKCPVGYVSGRAKQRNEKKQEPDQRDERLFPLVQRALKMFADGKYQTLAEMREDLDSWGMADFRGRRTPHQLAHKMLTQYLEFYAGYIRNPFNRNELYPGKHEAMISLYEMEQIQLIMKERRVQPMEKSVFQERFLLRGIVRCEACRKLLTAANSKGKTKIYGYYACHNPECALARKSIRVEMLETAFERWIETIQPSPAFMDLLEHYLKAHWENLKAEKETIHGQHKKELALLEEKMDRLQDAYLDGIFESKEQYMKKQEKLKDALTKMRARVRESEPKQVDLDNMMARARRFTSSMSGMWREMVRPENRQKLCRFVFPGGLNYGVEGGFSNSGIGEMFSIYKDYMDMSEADAANASKVTPRCITSNFWGIVEGLGEDF
jgi:DNA invertase Pin-like site-specific DNA recombinase